MRGGYRQKISSDADSAMLNVRYVELIGNIASFVRYCVSEALIGESDTTEMKLVKILSSREKYQATRVEVLSAYVTHGLGKVGDCYKAKVGAAGPVSLP